MTTIESAKYEGYLWYSDNVTPEIFYGNVVSGDIAFEDNDNPFVVEGNLWNNETRESISVRYIDGHYYVRRTIVSTDELAGLEASASTDQAVATSIKKYVPHRIEGVKFLKFLQYWAEEPDPMCEGMKALRPEKLVFIGFEND